MKTKLLAIAFILLASAAVLTAAVLTVLTLETFRDSAPPAAPGTDGEAESAAVRGAMPGSLLPHTRALPGEEETNREPEPRDILSLPATDAMGEGTETAPGTETPAESRSPEAALPAESTAVPDARTEPAPPAADTRREPEAAESAAAVPRGYLLYLEEGRLTVADPAGGIVCARPFPETGLPADLRRELEAGLIFPDEAAAVSALWDLLS